MHSKMISAAYLFAIGCIALGGVLASGLVVSIPDVAALSVTIGSISLAGFAFASLRGRQRMTPGRGSVAGTCLCVYLVLWSCVTSITILTFVPDATVASCVAFVSNPSAVSSLWWIIIGSSLWACSWAIFACWIRTRETHSCHESSRLSMCAMWLLPVGLGLSSLGISFGNAASISSASGVSTSDIQQVRQWSQLSLLTGATMVVSSLLSYKHYVMLFVGVTNNSRCTQCGYALVPSKGRCPECGALYGR
jgi:hypothetical protein